VVVHEQLHIFEHESGDWWAECQICQSWTSTSNATRVQAEKAIGERFRNEHAPDATSGVVFIARLDRDDEDGAYAGYWAGARAGGLLEQMPDTSSLSEALAAFSASPKCCSRSSSSALPTEQRRSPGQISTDALRSEAIWAGARHLALRRRCYVGGLDHRV
jgi:hypothetical protein